MEVIIITQEKFETNTKWIEAQNIRYFKSFNKLRKFMENLSKEEKIFLNNYVKYEFDDSLTQLAEECKNLIKVRNTILEC